jgi:quercetin dioxygenase-like cupin family protein
MQQIIEAGVGLNYNWDQDHIYIKTPLTLTAGRVTVVEDTLKPGFHLPAHYHKVMTEVFYILEGAVQFIFADETVVATPGMTINIPPNVIHEVRSEAGGKLITIFAPGGFDQYLAEMAALTPEQGADASLMQALAEKYDSWEAHSV